MRQSRLSEHQSDAEPAYRNDELLRYLYQEEELSTYEIADRLDCHSSTIRKWMEKNDVPTRGPRGSKQDAIYKQEGWLRENYIYKERSADELAEEVGVANTTILRWLDEHDIPRRPSASEIPEDARYTDSEWLYDKYWEEGLSMSDIGEIEGVNSSTIGTWLHRHDIEVRDEGRPKKPYATRYMSTSGYISWRSYHRERESEEHVAVHRLLAVAEYGFEALRGKHVHHINGVKWDNRPANIELRDPEEHVRFHAEQQKQERNERGQFVSR